MKKTLFALLACATLAAPAMAYNFTTTITLTLPALNVMQLEGNGGYSTAGLSSNYSSSDVTSVNATATGYVEYDGVDGGYYSAYLSDSTQQWSGNTYVITLTGPGGDTIASDSDTKLDYEVTLTLKPTNLTGVINGYDYTNATLSTTVWGSKAYVGVPELTAKVSTWTVSGATEAKTPEPATATLSLLAFAGLAARRRRH